MVLWEGWLLNIRIKNIWDFTFYQGYVLLTDINSPALPISTLAPLTYPPYLSKRGGLGSKMMGT